MPNPEDDGSIRPLEWVPGPELRNAMQTLVQDYGSMPVEAFLKETLKLFGGKQLSKASKSQLSLSLQAAGNKLVIQNDQVSEAEPGS